MAERDKLPEYGIDEKGYYDLTIHGKFRPIDIIDGAIQILRPRTLRDTLRDSYAITGTALDLEARRPKNLLDRLT